MPAESNIPESREERRTEPPDALPKELRLRLPRDIREILRLAEELQTSADGNAFRIQTLRLTQALGVATAAASFVYASYRFPTNSTIAMLWIGLGSILVLYIIFFEIAIGRFSRRGTRDSRALLQLVNLLRETELIFSRKQRWSPLERAQFRIRISRFDIGDQRDEFSGLLSMLLRRFLPSKETKTDPGLSDAEILKILDSEERPAKSVTVGRNRRLSRLSRLGEPRRGYIDSKVRESLKRQQIETSPVAYDRLLVSVRERLRESEEETESDEEWDRVVRSALSDALRNPAD